MLDTAKIPSIIYIWYEGGELRPALVKLEHFSELALAITREVPRSAERRVGRACQAAAASDIVSALAEKPT